MWIKSRAAQVEYVGQNLQQIPGPNSTPDAENRILSFHDALHIYRFWPARGISLNRRWIKSL